ncbi:MAG: permease-domain-containing protein [Monoraphidium minutum]|nr:MAG: permease-domain-containing protein [Monoraphidium minutum]
MDAAMRPACPQGAMRRVHQRARGAPLALPPQHRARSSGPGGAAQQQAQRRVHAGRQRHEQQQQRQRLAERRVACADSVGAAAASPGPDNLGSGPLGSGGRQPGTGPGSTAAAAKGTPDAMATVDLLEQVSGSTALSYLDRFKAPRWLFRTIACLVLGGQVMARIFKGKIHLRNTRDQLQLVGPKSLGVALLTAGFVGMVFTIQFVREFAKLGLTRSVGGVLALALARELTPVVTSIILAGRVGSAFAAELGTMQVSEQVDSLRVLATDPVDYLVTPRVLASMVAGPILNVLCFCMGIGASVLLADLVYNVPANVILDSARRALTGYDVITSCVKAWAFSTAISVISCAWGFTTSGGAKGVGESTTSAVVISLVTIFVLDFVLSYAFFQGQGDALKQLR